MFSMFMFSKLGFFTCKMMKIIHHLLVNSCGEQENICNNNNKKNEYIID